MTFDLQLMRATAAALDAIYEVNNSDSCDGKIDPKPCAGSLSQGQQRSRVEPHFTNARRESEIWRDAQSELWFRYDGVNWRAGRGMMPPDVRAAFLQQEIENERIQNNT